MTITQAYNILPPTMMGRGEGYEGKEFKLCIIKIPKKWVVAYSAPLIKHHQISLITVCKTLKEAVGKTIDYFKRHK